MCFQVLFEFSNVKFCLLQVASQLGDSKCVFKLSLNSVTSNFVRFESPVDGVLLQRLFHMSVCISFKLRVIGEFGFHCLSCQLSDISGECDL